MTLVENKQQLFTELKDKFQTEGAKVIMEDSILIKHGSLITKIPMQHCTEEIFILRTFKRVGIPTIEITDTGEIETSVGRAPFYTMEVVDGATDLIKHGNKFLTSDYYSFLKKVFDGLKTVHFSGFGSIQLTDSGVQTEYGSEKEFLESVLRRAEKRKNLPPGDLRKLREQLRKTRDTTESILTHTDILHNVLVNKDGTKFYLMDPQTIVSAANKYWDLSYYLIYANGFGCTDGLAEFLRQVKIDEWDKFLLTARINACERASFYMKYDPTKVPRIVAFLKSLNRNKIIIGNQTLSKNDI